MIYFLNSCAYARVNYAESPGCRPRINNPLPYIKGMGMQTTEKYVEEGNAFAGR